jgi:RNA polymerase sigma-70 factor (ECF subfamily)
MQTDQSPFEEFLATGSSAAFEALFGRYSGLVYGTALRQSGNPHAAEEIAQQVFLLFARKASTLTPQVCVGGWFHRTTCLVAKDYLRAEQRRRHREQKAVSMQDPQDATSSAVREELFRAIDSAVEELPEKDREILLLRFFERLDLREIATRFSISTDAAQQRAERAVDRLGTVLHQRGIPTATTTLTAALISLNSVTAPATLWVSVATAVSSSVGTAVFSGSSALAATKPLALLSSHNSTTLLFMKTSHLIITGAAIVGVSSLLVLNRSQEKRFQQQLAAAQSAQRSAEEQAGKAAQEQEALRKRLAELQNDIAEIHRLRGEINRLKNSPTPTTANASKTAPPAAPAAPEDTSAAEAQQKEMFIQRMNQAKGLVLGMMIHRQKTGAEPTNFAEVKQFVPSPLKEQSEQLDAFEFLPPTAAAASIPPENRIILRQKEFITTTDGKRARVYGFADGHSEVRTEGEQSLEQWEEERGVSQLRLQ